MSVVLLKIYEGQLLALKLLKADPDLEKKVAEMKEHEKEHLKYFEQQLADRKIRPTLFLPLWDLLGNCLDLVRSLVKKQLCSVLLQ